MARVTGVTLDQVVLLERLVPRPRVGALRALRLIERHVARRKRFSLGTTGAKALM